MFSYSFNAKKNITAFPNIALFLLTIGTIVTTITNTTFFNENCIEFFNVCWIGKSFLGNQIQFHIGVVGSAIVVPRLIMNQDIRDELKFRYLIPIIAAIIGLFLWI